MRIKTGETATVSMPVDVAFRCSTCKKSNVATETLKGEAYTATYFGINANRDLYGTAAANLKENLLEIIDTNNSKRYKKAAFTCKCQHCGHAEPWAKMNYTRLDSIKGLCLISLFFTGMPSLILLDSLGDPDMLSLQITMWSLFLGALCVMLAIIAYKKYHTKKMETAIAALPPESLPTILPHIKER